MPLVVVAIAAAIWPTIVGAMQSEQNEMRSEKKGNRRKASCAVCYDGKNQPTHTQTGTIETHVQTHKSDHDSSSTLYGRFSLFTRTPSTLVTNYAPANDVAST